MPVGIKLSDSIGIISKFITCQATAPISIPSKGFGYVSKPTSLATSSLKVPDELTSGFATH
jgi:hypothetical protein